MLMLEINWDVVISKLLWSISTIFLYDICLKIGIANVLLCNAEIHYLLTLQVSIYRLSALQGSIEYIQLSQLCQHNHFCDDNYY